MNYIISILAVLQALYLMKRVQKGRSRVVCLIYFQIIFNLIIKFIVGNTVVPSMFNYISDVVTVWILAEYFHQTGGKITSIPRNMLIFSGLLMGISILSYLMNFYSPLLYLWGARNNFRFLVFGMMCVAYLEKRDIGQIMDILFCFFLSNILVVTYQVFSVSYGAASVGDFISGLYSNGTERGGNGAMGWLMCLVCAYEAVRYLNGQMHGRRLAVSIIGSLYIAAVAEIKLFFLEIVVIGVLAMLFCKKTRRTLRFAALSAAALLVGVELLYLLFPQFAGFFRLRSMIRYVSSDHGYNSTGKNGGLDRLTAVSYTLRYFLTTWPRKLLGIGLGNADFSSYSFLTSDFYRKNGWNGYTYFSTSMVTLELGLVGLGAYYLWFLNLLGCALKTPVQSTEENSIRIFSGISAVIAFLMIFSNQTMKLEASAYMVQCVLAFPYILRKQGKKSGSPACDREFSCI